MTAVILTPLISYGRFGSGRERVGRAASVENFPKCQKCKQGDLVPLSDFGSQGAAIHYKAWACTNPECGFNIKIRNGDLYIDEPIASGALHSPRVR
jgi:hypothetical protein